MNLLLKLKPGVAIIEINAILAKPSQQRSFIEFSYCIRTQLNYNKQPQITTPVPSSKCQPSMSYSIRANQAIFKWPSNEVGPIDTGIEIVRSFYSCQSNRIEYKHEARIEKFKINALLHNLILILADARRILINIAHLIVDSQQTN